MHVVNDVRRLASLVALAASTIGFTPAPARAQCVQDWEQFSGDFPGGTVTASVADDAGSVASLYVAGGTQIFRSTDGDWYPIGSADALIRELLVFDEDGAGPNPPVLVAGGDFATIGGTNANHVAKWDGSSWSALGGGVDGPVNALLAFDEDGGGPNPPALYVGGEFTTAGGSGARRVARWFAAAWSPLGTGANDAVRALATFDDDAGGPHRTAVYAGGDFTRAGGVPASAVARWDGASWSPLGSGVDSPDAIVSSLAVFDHDAGGPLPPALLAGGSFSSAGGAAVNDVASWNGNSWSAVGSGTSFAYIIDLEVQDDDGGGPLSPALYAAEAVFGARVYRFDGSSWTSVSVTGPPADLRDLVAFDEDGAGSGPPHLYAGGYFEVYPPDGICRLARRVGSTWEWLSTGPSHGVASFATFDEDGQGSGAAELYLGGSFKFAGGQIASSIAKWDGVDWSPVGFGINATTSPAVLAMAVFDADGAGPASAQLFAGGSSMSLQSWNGSTWTSTGMWSTIRALAVFDDDGSGPVPGALYAGGLPQSGLQGGIQRYDGSNWTSLGSGLDDEARALAVYDADGAGPNLAALYVGGEFHTAGGQTANYLARWTGSAWSPLASETDGPVHCLAVLDEDGPGPQPPVLFAGGSFRHAGVVTTASIAKWNGTAWSGLAGGVAGTVASLAVFDEDGSGPQPPSLVAGGQFSSAGGVNTSSIARWNGTSWSALDAGVLGSVFALAVFDEDGSGPRPAGLVAGGSFSLDPALANVHMARWIGCASSIEGFCYGDGSSGPCPCGNAGATRRGCENSAGTGGARLSCAGNASLGDDTVVLTSTGELPVALSIFLQGTSASAPAPFGDGLRCASGTLERLFVHTATGGVVSAPSGADPAVSAQSAVHGDPLTTGSVRIYQTYYRDADPAFCPSPPGNTWNVSNAVSIVWNP